MKDPPKQYKYSNYWRKGVLDVVWETLLFYLSGFIWLELAVAATVFFLLFFLRNVLVENSFKMLRPLLKRIGLEMDSAVQAGLKNPLRSLIIILALYLFFTILPLSGAHHIIMVQFVRAASVVVIAWKLYELVDLYGFTQLSRKIDIKIDRMLIPLLRNFTKLLIVALTLSLIAQEMGFNVSGFVAGLGLGGLALALAAKDALSNIFGGIMIVTDKPFSIGDWIYTPSVEGTVEDISFRSTKVRTFANSVITVPNANLANEPITNWSRMGKRRISFHLGVTYNTPAGTLKICLEKMREALENHPAIHKETIFVRFDRFNESSLDIFLYFFTITTNWKEYLEIKEEINFRIMEILQQHKVSIAFPSRSIYLENAVNVNPWPNMLQLDYHTPPDNPQIEVISK